jgi:hypothetical protein
MVIHKLICSIQQMVTLMSTDGRACSSTQLHMTLRSNLIKCLRHHLMDIRAHAHLKQAISAFHEQHCQWLSNILVCTELQYQHLCPIIPSLLQMHHLTEFWQRYLEDNPVLPDNVPFCLPTGYQGGGPVSYVSMTNRRRRRTEGQDDERRHSV